MSQTHLHLLITHLPVFGSILGAIVLFYALWSNSNQTKIAAYFLFIISSIGAGIAYLTGEGAEEVVEKIQGVTESSIHAHEDAAFYSLISLIILGLMSLVALFVTNKNGSIVKPIAKATFVVSLLSFSLVARTGYLGGQIRHTEINGTAVQNNAGGENESGGENEEKEDD
jgi:uncharacterized membrane protein